MLGTLIVKKLRLWALRWHNKLAWWGGLTILLWGLSGIAHPLMAWFGPKSQQFLAPRLQVSGEQLQAVSRVLGEQAIDSARMLKVVPSGEGAILQLTQAADSPRRYFSLADQRELPDYDRRQALWLGQHYTGRPASEVESVEFIGEFNRHYPWVNRLLPVYKISYGGDDRLTAFVHTETGALASLMDGDKARLQVFFQALHTWSWLDFSGHGRVLVVALLMLSLVAMSVSGLKMVLLFRQRKLPQASRRWHRYLGYALWLPLLGWSVSGFYHLLQSAYVQPVAGLKLAPAFSLSATDLSTPLESDWLLQYQGRSLNSISLLALGKNESEGDAASPTSLAWRLSLQPALTEPVSRQQRYRGQPTEQQVVYRDAASGTPLVLDDRQYARQLATQFTAWPAERIVSMEKITRFGPGYDFRNKRLPVWQLQYDDAEQTRIFIDPQTAALVDRNRAIDRAESLSFALLHKWNHLTPLMGRQPRDILIVATLLLCLLASGMGVALLLARRRRVKVVAASLAPSCASR